MSFPQYRKYKQSGTEWLGEVPDHWRIDKVRRLFTIKKHVVGTLGFDVLSITQQGVKIRDIDSNDGQLSMDYSKYQLVRAGDFAMNHMDLLTGYVDISPISGVTSPDYRVFSVRDTIVAHPRFFLYLFQMGYKNKIFFAYGQGSSQLGRWRLPTEAFNELTFPVPTECEQVLIAQFLDGETAKIDALVDEQQRLIELLKEKRQAVISHAVTKGLNPDAPMTASGVPWIGAVPSDWMVVGLTRYLDSVVDYRGRTPTKVDDGVFLLTARNIRNGSIDYEASQEFISPHEYAAVMSRGRPDIGDVVFTTEAPLGQVANLDRTDVAIAQRVIKFRGIPGMVHNHFLKYWIMGAACQANLEMLATGSTALGIKGSKIGQVNFCLPPYSEQEAIVAHLDRLTGENDLLVSTVEQTIALLHERRDALISAAVTGKIDVGYLVGAEAA